MNTMKRFGLVVMLAFAGFAWAADLGASKAAGTVGEREDGYIGFVSAEPAADVAEMIQTINDQRRAEYERIAEANGLTRDQVEALAGQKAIERTAAGEFVYVGGAWQKKP